MYSFHRNSDNALSVGSEKEQDVGNANLIAIIFYAIVASLLVTLALWTIVLSIYRRTSLHDQELPSHRMREADSRRPETSNTNSSTRRQSNTNLVTRFVLDHFPVRSYDHESKAKSGDDIEIPCVGASPTEPCSSASFALPEMREAHKLDVIAEKNEASDSDGEDRCADEDEIDVAGDFFIL
jgi:hypothetical protein